MKELRSNLLNYYKEVTATSRPLLVLVLAYVLGILMSGVLESGLFLIFLASFGALLLAAWGFIAGWRVTGRLVLALAFLSGLLTGGLAWRGIDYGLLKYCNHYVTLEGRVDRAPEFRRDSVEYVLRVQSVQAGGEKFREPGKVLVRVAGKAGKFGYGDRLRVKGVLRRPISSGNPGAFDYQKYLERRGITAVIYVKGKNVQRVEGASSGPLGLALLLRDKIMEVNRETLPPVHAAMLNGMMFGCRGEIPRDLQEAFSEAGLAHVLCVSGLHVGLLLGGLLVLFNLLGLPVSRIPLAATPVLFFYAAMTGFGPSALRATIMALLLLWAHRLGRERDWPTSLAVAALVILAVNPLQVYEVGFQLSFAATWGILYLGPFLKKRMEPLPLPAWVKPVIQVTVSAQLGTLPIIIYYFNLVSFASVFTNLAAVPMAGIILFWGFAAGLAGLVVPLAAQVINAGTGILLGLFEWLVLFVGKIPGASCYMAAWPWWGIILWYAGLVAAVEWERVKGFIPPIDTRKSRVIIFISCLLAFLIWTGVKSDNLEVHFIDVGHGDSILVRMPGGKDMLVDAGGWRGDFDGEPGAGDYVVVPYLRRLGINKLDALVISHFHEDHAGGIRAVMRSVAVDRLIVPPAGTGAGIDPNVKVILEKARQMEIPVHFATAGDRLFLDERVGIFFWGPREKLFKGSRSDDNNNSLVLFLDYKEIEILLTGDIEEEMQSWLVQQGNLAPVEVLKVPHHGSRFFSPEFLQRVDPVIAVISVGERNTFNLPSGEIIRQLRDMGARIYRTDRDGAVIISTDGKKVKVRTGRH